jgi:putative transposase
MKTVCEVLGVSRSNLAVKSKRDAEWVDKRKTPARDDMPLVAELQGLVADLPTYGYRRAWALLRRNRDAQGQPRVNAKRVYRVMHTLLLTRYAFTNISRGATCSESLPPLKLKVCTGLRVP